mmetsp:Transcript_121092/g.270358  ORF Transcript_121092/g.270358 Transcript_121092/m.270358 type:complete len:343 (-) Transcript_121092:51-1079(-)
MADDSPTVLGIQTDVASPTTRGEKSVLITFPPGVTYKALMDLHIQDQSNPWIPLEVGGDIVKAIEKKELRPNELEFKVLADGKKLDRWKKGGRGDGTDKLMQWWLTMWNVEEKSFRGEFYFADVWIGQEVRRIQWSCWCKFISEGPLVLECFHLDSTQQRVAGAAPAFQIANLMDPLARMLSEHKVQVVENQLSPSNDGQSAISYPMDEFGTYDEFYSTILTLTLSTIKSGGIFTVIDESPTHLTGTFTPGDGYLRTMHMEHSQEEGLIVSQFLHGSELLETIYRQVHREPLMLEAWQVRDGKRDAGWAFAKKKIQHEVNLALFIIRTARAQRNSAWSCCVL